jgi:hypothetical protein
MSPRGRDCIGIALDIADELAPLYAAPAAPAPVQWVPVTEALFTSQADWLYEPMWIALKDGRVTTGVYEWRQGRGPDRLIGPEVGDEWAFNATHLMPLKKPEPSAIAASKEGKP